MQAYEAAYIATLASVEALQIQRSAIKSKKIDPAIAGGLANGLAGIGAGVYTAANAAARNEEIDRARVESKFNASMATSDSQSDRASAAASLPSGNSPAIPESSNPLAKTAIG